MPRDEQVPSALQIFQIFHSNELFLNQEMTKTTFYRKQNQRSAVEQDISLKTKIDYKNST